MNKEQAMSCAAKCMSSFNKYATKWNIPSHLTIEMWNIIKEVYDRMDSPITTLIEMEGLNLNIEKLFLMYFIMFMFVAVKMQDIIHLLLSQNM